MEGVCIMKVCIQNLSRTAMFRKRQTTRFFFFEWADLNEYGIKKDH